MTLAVAAGLALALLLGGAAGAHAACDECVTAGAAQAPLAVPASTSLGGFGSFARRLLDFGTRAGSTYAKLAASDRSASPG